MSHQPVADISRTKKKVAASSGVLAAHHLQVFLGLTSPNVQPRQLHVRFGNPGTPWANYAPDARALEDSSIGVSDSLQRSEAYGAIE